MTLTKWMIGIAICVIVLFVEKGMKLVTGWLPVVLLSEIIPVQCKLVSLSLFLLGSKVLVSIFRESFLRTKRQKTSTYKECQTQIERRIRLSHEEIPEVRCSYTNLYFAEHCSYHSSQYKPSQ